MSEKLGTLTRRLVDPTAPVLLTKNGPLGAFIKHHRQLYLTQLKTQAPAILRETSEGTSY